MMLPVLGSVKLTSGPMERLSHPANSLRRRREPYQRPRLGQRSRLLRLVRSELLRYYPGPGRGGDAASASRSGSEGRQGAVYGAPAITAVGKDPADEEPAITAGGDDPADEEPAITAVGEDPADEEPALFVPVTSTSTVDPTSEPSST